GESIANTAKTAPAGATIIVGPGLYAPVVFQAGDIQDGLYFFADVTGELTGASPAPVVIEARGGAAAVKLSGQSNVIFDSFTLRGGAVAGFLAVSSPGTTVEDCIISGNRDNGVLFQDADNGLVFNNLVTNGGGVGIQVLGSAGVEVINNTVYGSAQSGLSVSGASSDTFVENNIFSHNRQGIVVDASATGYQADFNLNTDGYHGTGSGPDDVLTDPELIFPAQGDPTGGADFHLAQSSPAIDAGDANIGADLEAFLEQLTTQSDGTLDSPPPDLGYHYPAPVQPTPVVKSTRTATPRPGTPTATRKPVTGTPTRTLTPTTTPKGAHGGTPTPRPTKTPRR
ncbi:MAG: right-handed parallel beta-helix repeat-containing protein, partial [Candidatus Binatia bacterium]